MTAMPPNDSFGDSAASARAAQRDSLFLLGTLEFDGQSTKHEIRIRNLSATGLMAQGKIVGKVGQDVFIETKNLGRVRGSIAWVTDGRMGIAFENLIDPSVARQPIGKQQVDLPDFLRNQQALSRRPGF
jgi:hypothetical protein